MTALTSGTGTGPSGVAGANSARSAWPCPRSVSLATARPGDGGVGDLALEVDPEVGERGRPHLARLDRPPRGGRAGRPPRRGRSPEISAESVMPAAVVAAPAVDGLGVVELVAEEAHPALVGLEVVEHRPLLPLAGLGHPAVALLVVGPLPAGGLPAAADPAYGAVDVEHLEHGLEAGAVELDVGLEGGGAERLAGVGEGGEGLADELLAGEGERAEVGPDVAVLDRRAAARRWPRRCRGRRGRPAGSRRPGTPGRPC